jgi:hypothetical protein
MQMECIPSTEYSVLDRSMIKAFRCWRGPCRWRRTNENYSLYRPNLFGGSNLACCDLAGRGVLDSSWGPTRSQDCPGYGFQYKLGNFDSERGWVLARGRRGQRKVPGVHRHVLGGGLPPKFAYGSPLPTPLGPTTPHALGTAGHQFGLHHRHTCYVYTDLSVTKDARP